MKYEYDADADVLLVKLRKEKPDFGEQEGNIMKKTIAAKQAGTSFAVTA